MKIIKTISRKKNKKENKIHTLEVSEKELVILAALLGKSTYGGNIVTDMCKSVATYYPVACELIGNTNLDDVVKFIEQTYED